VQALAASMVIACGSELGPELAAPYDNPAVGKALTRAVPPGWQLAESKPDQIPWGHHSSDGYKGHGGTKLTLVGPQDVEFRWSDSSGQQHEEPLAKESLELWIMPGRYREGMSALDFHAPVPADLIFSSTNVRIYGQPSHRIVARQRFGELLRQATATDWPLSPGRWKTPLSWAAWKPDLERAASEVVQ
jgi:hypothetical protein